MSLVGRREEIAAALSMVAGVKGHQYRPAGPKAGDGWPLLGSLERADGRAFTVTWRVLIVLPSHERAASQWFDAHYEDVSDALHAVGFVDRIEPVALATDAGDMHAMQITMRGE